MLMRQTHTGFTIVELLIVIVVIGILAAITVVSYSTIQERARVSRASADLQTLAKSIKTARLSQNKVLKDITLNNCTACGTQATYELTLDRIGQAAGVNLSGLKSGNPWGAKYSIDENELENMSVNNGCNRDTIAAGAGASASVTVPIIPTYSC
jgi:prepilin-type N-terminal cleavage/methylation domain-containing protein